MSKAEIIAELAHLTPQDLAEVRAWLDRFAPQEPTGDSITSKNRPVHIRSPRFAHPAQTRDFIKQVTELPADTLVTISP